MSIRESELDRALRYRAIQEKKIQLKEQRRKDDKHLAFLESARLYNSLHEQDNSAKEYINFKNKVEEAFVSEALLCLTRSCINSAILSEQYNSDLTKQLVTGFVQEQGAHNLIRKFKKTSYLLSELAFVCESAIDSVMEKADPKDSSSLKIDKKDKDKFYKALDNTDADKAVNVIKSRVADATQEFIDTNTKAKMQIKDVLVKTKEKIDNSRKDSIKESVAYKGQREISSIRNTKIQNVFEAMVYGMSRIALKNEDAQKVFVENAQLNMDKIVEHCEVMYTFLSVLDTCKIVDVNEAYIREMLDDMKKNAK